MTVPGELWSVIELFWEHRGREGSLGIPVLCLVLFSTEDVGTGTLY